MWANTFVSFQHSVESVDSLSSAVDRQQLTPDLNGTFQYHHLRWLEFRLVRCLDPSVHFDEFCLFQKLETFVYNSKETLHAYELLYNDLQQAELATNVARAQDAIETHMTVFKDQLSTCEHWSTDYWRTTFAHHVERSEWQWVDGQIAVTTTTNLSIGLLRWSEKDLSRTSEVTERLILIALFSKVMDNLRSAKDRCFQLWHQKKNRLEQNLQLRLFEQDCDRVQIEKSISSFRYAFSRF